VTRTPPTSPGASSAFGWSLANTVVSRLATLGIGIVLARVLGPEEFGTFAVALIALMAVLSFNELGVSLAIVRWPENPKRIVPTVNTISVCGSVLFCGAAFAAAPAFTSAMGDPEATDVVRVLILSVLVNGIVASPAALLQRTFREKPRMVIDQVNVWAGSILSLVLALTGMGAMSLAIGRLGGSVIAAVLFLAVSPLPYRFGLDRSLLGPLLRFGLPLAGTSIIVFVVGYADQVIVGSVLGAVFLGFYVLAFNLSSFPVGIVSQPLRRVAPAAFSSLQHREMDLQAAFVSLAGIVAAAILPLIAFIAGAAVPLVSFVYGEVWTPAAAALSWLVVGAACRVFCELAYDYLVVKGKSGSVFSVQVGSLVVLIPALIAGALVNGLAGLAAAQAATAVLVILPLYLWRLTRTGIAVRRLAATVWVPVVASVLVGLASWGLAVRLGSPFWSLAAGGLLAAAVSFVLIYHRRADLNRLRTIGPTVTSNASGAGTAESDEEMVT
jgi:O-antigen/teichoic acid export membrane protein